MLPHLNSDMEKKEWGSREAYKPTIVTALFDGHMTGVPHTVGVYDPAYVEKLYRGFKRNLTIPFDFICLVDKNYIFQEDIKAVRFKRSVDQYGWMSLMEMYRPEICQGIRLTVGLDTIITGPVDDILQAQVSKFAVCTDPMYPNQICNAITLSTPEFCEEFWGMWEGNEVKLIPDSKLVLENVAPAPSEMVLMRKYYGDSPCIDKVFPNRILSYKVHVKENEHPIDKLEGVSHNVYQNRLKLIERSSIIYFHGWPKPHNIAEQRWVRENWK